MVDNGEVTERSGVDLKEHMNKKGPRNVRYGDKRYAVWDDVPVRIRMDGGTLERLRAQAKRAGMDIETLACAAIHRHLFEQEKQHEEALKRLKRRARVESSSNGQQR